MSAAEPKKASAERIEEFFDTMRSEGRPDPQPLKEWWQYCVHKGLDPHTPVDSSILDAHGLMLAHALHLYWMELIWWGKAHGKNVLDPIEVRNDILASMVPVSLRAATEAQRSRNISNSKKGSTGKPMPEEYWQRMRQYDGDPQEVIHQIAIEAFPGWKLHEQFDSASGDYVKDQPPSLKTVNDLHRRARKMARRGEI